MEHTARFLAHITLAANNCPVVGEEGWCNVRDSIASRKVASELRVSRASQPKASAIAHRRPPNLGGHSLISAGKHWKCTTCKARSLQWNKLACRKCSGSVSLKWAEAAQKAAASGNFRHATHALFLSDDVVSCGKCGAYGSDTAIGLCKACPEIVPRYSTGGGGRAQQLRRLLHGRHPRDGRYIGPGVPIGGTGHSTISFNADIPEQCRGNCAHVVHSPSGPSFSPSHTADSDCRRSALLERIRAKEAVLKRKPQAHVDEPCHKTSRTIDVIDAFFRRYEGQTTAGLY